jgi:hypothetical protein
LPEQVSEKRRGDRRGAFRRRAERGPILIERRNGISDRRTTERRTPEPLLDGFLKYNPLSDEIYKRIEVREPYFALKDMRVVDPHVLEAKIPVQQPLGREVSPIVAAEAGRHLAILGACAISLAKQNGERYYYLAYGAELERACMQTKGTEHSYLYAKAQPRVLSDRLSLAQCDLSTEDGTIVYKILVNYLMIPEKVFLKRYGKMKSEMRSSVRDFAPFDVKDQNAFVSLRKNPYNTNYPFQTMEVTSNKLTASLGLIEKDKCKGHSATDKKLGDMWLTLSVTNN